MTLITLQQIRDKSPCREGWKKLLEYLGNPDDMNTTVSIGDVAKSNGAQDALWCFRCLPDSERRNIIRAILPAVTRASNHSKDKRVTDCIAVTERWLKDKATTDELRAANANAANAAADVAALAAYAALIAYAALAAYAALTANANAEKKQQVEDIIAIFPTTR